MPRLFHETAIWHWEHVEHSWFKPFTKSIRQIIWAYDYMDDIAADFLFIANVSIDPDEDDYAGMNSHRFWAHVRRLPGYEGSVQRRMIKEVEAAKKKKEEKAQAYKLPNGGWNWKALAAKAKAEGAQLERA